MRREGSAGAASVAPWTPRTVLPWLEHAFRHEHQPVQVERASAASPTSALGVRP